MTGGSADPDSGLESLLAFPSELQAAPSPRPAWQLVVMGAVAATVCFAAFELVQWKWLGTQASVATGGLTVETRPPGADVLIDGEHRGLTPLTLSLSPGAHALAVRLGEDERAVPLTVSAGGAIAQYFEMHAATPPPELGTISVVTTPAGVRVTVDGEARGVSPLTVTGLAAGEHRVAVASDATNATRTVSVQPGATTAVVFSPAAETGPVGGWLNVSSPFDVQVREGNEVVGVSATSRIMLAAGRHDVTLVNTSLEYAEPMRIDIVAGRVTTLRVDPPKAGLNVNARPWADVSIDNTDAGQTPIANLPLAVGTHQIVFRHPQLGERRQNIVITAKGPNRISVDLTK